MSNGERLAAGARKEGVSNITLPPVKKLEHAQAHLEAHDEGPFVITLPDFTAVRIEIFPSFCAAEATWRRAQCECACYGFQTFEWLSTYQETIGTAENVQPHIVHIADISGRTLMLMPLGMKGRLGVTTLSFLGGGPTDYHAPLICPEFAGRLDAIACERILLSVQGRLPRADVISFEKMPSKIDGVPNPFAKLPDAKHHRNAYAATLGASFSEFKKRRSAKFFSAAARKWRRLCEVSPAKYRIAETAPAAADIWGELMPQKRRQYRRAGVRDPLTSAHYRAFYSAMAERHCGTGLIHTSALYAGESLVAAHWGLVFRDRFYWIMPSHEVGIWARFSPGRLLMQFLIKNSIIRNLRTFDLTIGDDDYKKLWADQTLPLYKCMRGLTLRGKVYCALYIMFCRLMEWARQNRWSVRLVRAWRRRKSDPLSESARPLNRQTRFFLNLGVAGSMALKIVEMADGLCIRIAYSLQGSF
jgi:CelD/BcsL family acetyltransferase involved in cellulose biosynthesis